MVKVYVNAAAPTNARVTLKRANFKRLASARIEKVVLAIHTLKALSHKGNYEYTEKDIEKLETVLLNEIEDLTTCFRAMLSNSKKVSNLISFD